MYHGSVDEMRSGAGTLRHSNDGHRRSSLGPRSATSRSDRVPSYPSYTNPPTSASGGTDMDYDYEERDLGTSYQHRLHYDQNLQMGPRSHSSASPVPDGGYSWDPNQRHPNMPYSPPPKDFASAHYNAPPSQHLFPGAFPDHHSEPTRPNDQYWYAGPASSSPSTFGYFPVTPLSHDSDPALFGIKAPHHQSGHHRDFYQNRQGDVLPNFPQWSRTWYDGHMSPNGHAYTSVPPPASGQTGWESETMSRQGPPSGPYGHVYSHQNMTDFVKEERIRMLEKEFGQPKMSHRGAKDGMDDDDELEEGYAEDEDLPLGSVTSKGKLVTEKPKWNLALRILIGLISVISCACGLGGALLIKTTSDNKPAPKGTLPAYLLYGCSVITLIILIYFYLFRPCCCDPMRKELQGGFDSGNPFSGMVIPILSGAGPGGKIPKPKKYDKKGFRGMQQQAPTVNLIVDPALLGAMGRGNKDDSDDDERLPGDARRSRKRKNGLGVLGNMQMQRRWQLAKSRVKLLTFLDVILCILWIACDVISLGLGKKCPASTGGTWCTFYNLTIASGVILAVLFMVAIYLDFRDLRVSRNRPKPPM